MAGRIRDEDVALVRERAPIAEVVGEYLQLRSAGGGSLKGLCPFHDESSPSFNVTPARGLYYCFGCGAGGDVISFVQQMEHLSFVESVESLAQQAGVRLRYEEGGYTSRGDQGQRQQLLEANKAAQQYYAELLLSQQAIEGRRFLTQRGFKQPDAEHFGVGFAPPGWESLTRHLRHRGFTDREIIDAGLASQGRRGPYDRFRNRLVWPVRDLTGDVVGFGARKLSSDDDGPKYLNTPETLLFKKGHLLYGLDLAKRDISQRGEAVVVEGYTDVMACHMAGVPTAVATCGTSFGGEHAKALQRFLRGRSNRDHKVIFTFDGDTAGQRAALRAFEEIQDLDLMGRVAVQPDELDPCELWVQRGHGAVQSLVAGHRPLLRFVIDTRIKDHDLDSNEGRLAAVDAVAPVIATIRERDLRDKYARDVAGQVGFLDDQRVVERIRRHVSGKGQAARRSAAGASPAGDSAPYDRRDPTVRRERQALKVAVQHPALAADFDQFEEDVFTVPLHRAIHGLIRAQGGVAASDAPQAWVMRLRDNAADDSQRSFVHELAVEGIEVNGEFDEHQAGMILGTVSYHSIGRREANLKSRLARLDPASDPEEHTRVFAELMAAQQQKRLMRERSEGGM